MMMSESTTCTVRSRSTGSRQSQGQVQSKEDSLPDLMMVSDGSTTESIDFPGPPGPGVKISNSNSMGEGEGEGEGDADGVALSTVSVDGAKSLADSHGSATALHSNTHTQPHTQPQPQPQSPKLKDASSSSRSSSRRKPLPPQRTQSVPMLQTDTQHTATGTGTGTGTGTTGNSNIDHGERKPMPMRLSSFIQENRSQSRIAITANSNDGEDSTIEESWRPNPAQRIRDISAPTRKSTRSNSTGNSSAAASTGTSITGTSSTNGSKKKTKSSPKSKPSTSHSIAGTTPARTGIAGTAGTAGVTTQGNSQLEGFLDSLLQGAAGYSRKSPGAGYRKRIENRQSNNNTTTATGTSEASMASNKSGRATATATSKAPSIDGSSAGHLGPGQEPSMISDDVLSRSSSITSASRRSTGLGLARGMGLSGFSNSETDKATRSNSMSMSNSNPIAWTRKESVIRTANHRERNATSPQFSTNERLLSTFLDRESRHRRTSSAHTISGDPRVSIAISSVDGAKTFTVGPKEAQMIQQLLEASHSTALVDEARAHADVSSHHHRHPATTPLSPTPMDPNMMVSHHEASTIAESERISTRSSLFVELSPPLAKHNTLTHYLEDRRGRRKSRSSAFTVAGDKVSVRFQGKSTSELVELLKEEKRESAKKMTVRPTKSGARHPRSDLLNMASVPDLDAMNAMHESIQFLGPPIFDSPPQSNALHSSRVTRAELQSLLDGRSPNTMRRRLSGSHSVSGPGMFSSTGSNTTTNKRPSSRQKSLQRNKSQELTEFEFTSSSAKPTNRRTMMRKMHSVPMLIDQPGTSRASSRDRRSRQRSKERADVRSTSREQRRKRREASETRDPKADDSQQPPRSRSLDPYCTNNAPSTITTPSTTPLRKVVKSDSVRRARKKSDVSESEPPSKRNDQEQQPESSTDGEELQIEDLHKSFLDQFLDHDVEAHDSASQMKLHKDEYKASLREIPKDPKKTRSTDYKRVKSGLEQPSPRLALLYDSSPGGSAKKTEQDKDNKVSKPTTDSSVNLSKSNQESNSDAKKSPSDKKKDSKKSPKKKGSKVKIELVDHKSYESSSELKNSVETVVAEPPATGPLLTPSERVTLSDLPRQRIEKTIDIPDTSGHARLASRIKILSNKTLDSDNKPGKLVAKRVDNKEPELTLSHGLHNASSSTMETQEEISLKTPRTSSEFSGWTKKGVGRPPLSNDAPAVVPSSDEKNTPPTQPRRKKSRAGDKEAHVKNVFPGPSRLPPVTIAEGSFLEVSDDNSVCSDITDAFSWEPQEVDNSRRTRKNELGRIDEAESSEHFQRTIGGTSWGDLSVSDDKRDDTSFLSRDKRMHVAKRWQSTPSLNGARQFDALRSPMRELEAGIAAETATPGRFDWLKKKMGIAKAKKM